MEKPGFEGGHDWANILSEFMSQDETVKKQMISAIDQPADSELLRWKIIQCTT